MKTIWENDRVRFAYFTYEGRESLPSPYWEDFFRYSIPGTPYRVLYHKETLGMIMSDTEYERYTCKRLIDASRGDVLMIGLGMDFMTQGILNRSDSLTILEKYQDIIDHNNSDAEVVLGDAYDAREIFKDRKFDIIINDFDDPGTGMGPNGLANKHLKPLLKEGGELLNWMKIELIENLDGNYIRSLQPYLPGRDNS